MKKIILLGALACLLMQGKIYAQAIPNGGFETWNTGSYETPLYYPFSSNPGTFFRNQPGYNVVKVSPGYHGTYAIQLTTSTSMFGDTNTGFFANINPNGNPTTWSGGMPYSQKPTGIRGYFKNNEVTGDSGIIIVTFSKSGSNIGSYFFTLGGVHTTWTLFNLTFSPALSVTPDSVAFGATSSNVVSNYQIAGSTITIDSVSFTGVSSQPADMNGDFESWQTQTVIKPANWFYNGDQSGDGMNRTSDAYKGNYAIELKTYSKNGDHGLQVNPGRIGTGWYPNCHSNCQEQGGYPFTNQVDTLAFAYKYTPSGNDTAFVNLNFKKNGSQIWGTSIFLHSSSNYQYFEFPFNTGSVPDSVTIDLQSSSYGDSALSFVGSDLKIDEIHFKSQPLHTGINEFTVYGAQFAAYPNPATDILYIRFAGNLSESVQFMIYDIAGRLLKEEVFKITSSTDPIQLNIANLSPGLYHYQVISNEGVVWNKFVKN